LRFLKIILFPLLVQLLMTQFTLAEKVELTSDSMNAIENKKEVHFIGNAKVKQLKDWIHADKIIVHLTQENKAKIYEALGNATFEFQNEKGHYIGNSNQVQYFPLQSLYILTGKAKVEDKLNKRTIKGEKITVDMLTGNSKVTSTGNSPVKMTFGTDK